MKIDSMKISSASEMTITQLESYLEIPIDARLHKLGVYQRFWALVFKGIKINFDIISTPGTLFLQRIPKQNNYLNANGAVRL